MELWGLEPLAHWSLKPLARPGPGNGVWSLEPLAVKRRAWGLEMELLSLGLLAHRKGET